MFARIPGIRKVPERIEGGSAKPPPAVQIGAASNLFLEIRVSRKPRAARFAVTVTKLSHDRAAASSSRTPPSGPEVSLLRAGFRTTFLPSHLLGAATGRDATIGGRYEENCKRMPRPALRVRHDERRSGRRSHRLERADVPRGAHRRDLADQHNPGGGDGSGRDVRRRQRHQSTLHAYLRRAGGAARSLSTRSSGAGCVRHAQQAVRRITSQSATGGLRRSTHRVVCGNCRRRIGGIDRERRGVGPERRRSDFHHPLDRRV